MKADEMVFRDRQEAGKLLGEAVARFLADAPGHPLVLGLPRGGVPVGHQVAAAIGAEFDVVVARKIGVPWHHDYGIGAVAADGEALFDDDLLVQLGLRVEDLAGQIARERQEAVRRTQRYRSDRPAPRIEGRLVVVVDDGLATGATARVALRSVRAARPATLLFAAPVCGALAQESLRADADAVICVCTPPDFRAVGLHYLDCAQLTDADVDVEKELCLQPAKQPTESKIQQPAKQPTESKIQQPAKQPTESKIQQPAKQPTE